MHPPHVLQKFILPILILLMLTGCSSPSTPAQTPDPLVNQIPDTSVNQIPESPASPTVSAEEDHKWAALYLNVLSDQLETIAERDAWMYSESLDYYFHGILHDMDQDGIPELILSYPHWQNSTPLWYYAYSIHSYQNGTLKTIARDITFDASAAAAGGSGSTSVVILDGEPMIITLAESGATSVGSGTYMERNYEVSIYPYNSHNACKQLTVKTGDSGIAYYIDGTNVAEDYFESQVNAITYLSFNNAPPQVSFVCSFDTMKARELEDYLTGLCG